jgi:MerR family transcriptional regulator, copper efflux regulator
MAGLLIGELAKRAGVSPPTIRYYEEIGLLPAVSRSSSGYRRYSEGAVEDLRFIRKAQALGFALDDVREILKLSRSGKTPCERVRALAHEHLAAVDERIRQLLSFRDHLAADLARWDAEETSVTCRGLCQWITDAAPDADTTAVAATLRTRPPAKPGRKAPR